MRTAECEALESIGMGTTECKALESIIDYYRKCGKHAPKQDNEPVDHQDKSSIYPARLITLTHSLS